MKSKTIAATLPATAILLTATISISNAAATEKRTVKPQKPTIIKPRIPRIVRPTQQNTVPLAITSPKKYEGWGTDAKHTITWTTTLPANTNLKIELIQNDVAQTPYRTLTSSAPNTGRYEWDGIPAAQYNSVSRTLRVRISTLDESQVTVGDVFTFGKPLYFLEPSAAYTWPKNSVQSIMWEIVTEMPQPMRLDLLDPNHNQVFNIASNLDKSPRASTNKREAYRWTVPSNLAAGSYFIKLSSGSIAMEKPINIGN